MITIGMIDFDDFQGVIETPRRRVERFALTDRDHAGAALMPVTGRQFEISTVRYDAPAAVDALAVSLESLIGTIQPIQIAGLDYVITHNAKFVVDDLRSDPIEALIRAVGRRGVFSYNHAPAAALRTRWTLHATRAA